MGRHDQDPAKARELLLDELKDAVGEDAVREADVDVDRSISRQPRSLRGAFVSSRLMILVIGGALLVVGVIVALATESWIWFGVALLVHAVLSAVVIGSAFAQTTQIEKPSPTAVTALEEQGVADPEGALNDLVEQVAGEEEGSRVKRAAAEPGDAGHADQDQALAAAKQQSATTPASEPTRTTGPG